MEEKAALRRAIKERLQDLSLNDRRVESNVIVREISKLIPKEARTIAVFSPYQDEPNITPLITELLEQKRVICLGKNEANHMIMHRIFSIDDIARNPLTNIPEPTAHNPIDEKTIDVVIVPGRAFTRECSRMGRGNGGYDIWIKAQRTRNAATLYIGVCFDCQILQELPEEPHDERMDVVITSRGTHRKNNVHSTSREQR